MARKLPPLNALKAFEAAARNMSFTQAAEELFVTQAAISHQIKTLESFLGIKLFRRAHRKLLLTEEGQQYFRDIKDLFTGLAEATERLLERKASGALTVSTTPSFATQWLVPRLSEFSQLHPDIDVRIRATDREEGHLDQDVDVAFYYGKGKWPGVKAEQLQSDFRIPVCSPELAKQLGSVEDLCNVTLLHDNSRQDWRRWLRQVGAKRVKATQGPIFSHSIMAQQAALLGQGVALGHSLLTRPDIEAGRLVCPFKQALLSSNAHYMVYQSDQGTPGRIEAFRDWVLDSIRREAGEDDGRQHDAG